MVYQRGGFPDPDAGTRGSFKGGKGGPFLEAQEGGEVEAEAVVRENTTDEEAGF